MQVRAAVPMYLLSRKIKALGFKVVMSGEGADEVFGGYLYFHKAPNPAEFHRYLLLFSSLTATQVASQHIDNLLMKFCFYFFKFFNFFNDSTFLVIKF